MEHLLAGELWRGLDDLACGLKISQFEGCVQPRGNLFCVGEKM